MKKRGTLILVMISVLGLMGCAFGARPQPGQLRFRVALFEEVTEEFVLSLEVQNTGPRQTRRLPQVNAMMELRDAHNILVAREPVTSLISIESDAILNPAIWRGRLSPGSYRVLWGAPDLGYSETHFDIVEQAGRRQLGEEVDQHFYPERELPDLPRWGEAQPAVDRAVVLLRDRLGAREEWIRVERVEAEAPEAARFEIDLSYQGLPYVYEGSADGVEEVTGE